MPSRSYASYTLLAGRAKIHIFGVRESVGFNKLLLEFGVRDEYEKVRYIKLTLS